MRKSNKLNETCKQTGAIRRTNGPDRYFAITYQSRLFGLQHPFIRELKIRGVRLCRWADPDRNSIYVSGVFTVLDREW